MNWVKTIKTLLILIGIGVLAYLLGHIKVEVAGGSTTTSLNPPEGAQYENGWYTSSLFGEYDQFFECAQIEFHFTGMVEEGEVRFYIENEAGKQCWSWSAKAGDDFDKTVMIPKPGKGADLYYSVTSKTAGTIHIETTKWRYAYTKIID